MPTTARRIHANFVGRATLKNIARQTSEKDYAPRRGSVRVMMSLMPV
jgi:hypothetical protein